MPFNSPPNWPSPPPGWEPPPGWKPDPAWGPAPVGWDFGSSPIEPARQNARASGPQVQSPQSNTLAVPDPRTRGKTPRWLFILVPILALAIIVPVVLWLRPENRSDGDTPELTTSATTSVSTGSPSSVPSAPVTPGTKTGATSPPGTVTGGLSPDKRYALYKGTGNVNIDIEKPEAGWNLVTIDYEGGGDFKAWQINADGENTHTLLSLTEYSYYRGKTLLDFYTGDDETDSKQIRVKSNRGAWTIRIDKRSVVREISDVKTYEGKNDDVLYYPFSVTTLFTIRHPSDGPFHVTFFSSETGEEVPMVEDEKGEYLSFRMPLKQRGLVFFISNGAWSINPD